MGIATGTGDVGESEESDSDMRERTVLGALLSHLLVASVRHSLAVVPPPCKNEKVWCVQGWGPTSPLRAMEQRTEGLP